MKESVKRETAIKLAKVLKEKGSLPVKVKQVLSKNLKKATPDPKSKRAKQFYNHHKYHSGPHITGQGAEHATYDFDDDDYEVDGGIQRRMKKDKQKRGYEPVESINMIKLKDILAEKKELGGAKIDQLYDLTDRNNHSEARLELAKAVGDKKLIAAYEGIVAIHLYLRRANEIGPARDALDKKLFAMTKKVFSDYDAIYGAF